MKKILLILIFISCNKIKNTISNVEDVVIGDSIYNNQPIDTVPSLALRRSFVYSDTVHYKIDSTGDTMYCQYPYNIISGGDTITNNYFSKGVIVIIGNNLYLTAPIISRNTYLKQQ